MKQEQENKKNMIDATVAYMDEHAGTWQSIPKIGEVKNELDALKEGIDEAAAEQAGAQLKTGEIKLALKKTLATKLDILNDVAEVKAIMEGDEELAQQMSDSKSALYRMPYNDFIRKGKLDYTGGEGQRGGLDHRIRPDAGAGDGCGK